MIIVGYQGIGKSTLANCCLKYIDLESGCFWVNGKRAEDWYIPYCQMAEYLSKQGYYVFTSSHEPVRKLLTKSSEKVIAICPHPDLRDEWIAKLRKRAEDTGLEKDHKAFLNAADRYTENINEIANDIEDTRYITSLEYDLEGIINGKLG